MSAQFCISDIRVAMQLINCNGIVAKISPIQLMGDGELPP